MKLHKIFLAVAVSAACFGSMIPVHAVEQITDLKWNTNGTETMLDDTLTFTAPEGYRNKIFTPGANKYYYQLVDASITQKDSNGSLNNTTNLANNQGTFDAGTNTVTITLSKITGFGKKFVYQYYVRIGYYSNGFQTLYQSNTLDIDYNGHAPSAPTNIKQGKNQNYVSWDAVEGAASYDIAHYSANGTLLESQGNTKNCITFGDEAAKTQALSNGDIIKIKAVNAYGSSAETSYTAVITLSSKKMYRLYNPNTGEHFYTASDEEREYVIEAGWNYEGVGWLAPAEGLPVYRLYNANGGEHHYTMSMDECDMLTNAGWTLEGVGWYSDPNQSVPLYREYNPNQFSCNHNYSPSTDERDWLVSLGWQDEGISWYGVSE